MIESDCAVGCGCRAEIFEIALGFVRKLGADPFVETVDIRHVLNHFHTDCAAENLRFGNFGRFDFDNPGCLSALVGEKTEFGNVTDNRAEQI